MRQWTQPSVGIAWLRGTSFSNSPSPCCSIPARRSCVSSAKLRTLGVGIAIDDFGTGFASLRYLATLPVSAVKIDRSFTSSMTSDATSSSIVGAIINLARDLKLGCVVEGIETLDQLEALPNSVQGQGYPLGRPAEIASDTWNP
ncbi:EAL domain-containing protein [Rhodococcoides fascians]|uniref:EAL domain-containing protein n=1 Tax=Rhodococcoides fascians TaxID=1828 RepID=UPI0022A8B4C6|nr:EAL domain-containing protein [Rhodococcus fascians]